MENWTDNLIYLFWTAYPPLGRSDHNSKKERFPGGGPLGGAPFGVWGLSFPVRASNHLPSAAPLAPFNSGVSDRINSNYFIILKYYDHGRPEKKNPAIKQRQAN